MSDEVCPDCGAGNHLRSECPVHLPCPYWLDSLHCFSGNLRMEGFIPQTTVMRWYSKRCACGATVKPKTGSP